MINERIKAIPMPDRIKALPVNSNGFPIPYFVATGLDDTRNDLRLTDPKKIVSAINGERCWICGQPTGRMVAFIIGPMCVVNHISAEPPSHLDCAEYAVRACPFLSQPKMRRNEKDLPEDQIDSPGIMVKRNPGVTAIWITKADNWRVHSKGAAAGLITIGSVPFEVRWYREGRKATREEVLHSVETGLPALRAHCLTPDDHKLLDLEIARAQPWFEAA